MRTVDRLVLLASENARARAYLDRMSKAGLRPQRAIVLNVPSIVQASVRSMPSALFDNQTPVEAKCEQLGIPTQKIEADHINQPHVIRQVLQLPADYAVFAGPAGAILAEDYFSGHMKFIHVHPGRLPQFRGSTPYYYELFMRGRMTATAILMAAKLDAGQIIAEREFALPEQVQTLDLEFDPWMRAEILIPVLEELATAGSISSARNQVGPAQTFYVIHPVLKSLAVLQAKAHAS